MTSGAEGRHQDERTGGPDRAIIDIGSNTVRLVIYSGSHRVPRAWHNEKVSALLGRDLSVSGRISGEAFDRALAALARFATILSDLAVEDVECVATAAAREAENGPEFLEAVRRVGLSPRLLSGEEEARGSAFGVIGAFPGAQGTVADLGGGSLELVMIEKGDCHDGVSLPLGTLRLPALQALGAEGFRRSVKAEMGKAGWAAAHPGPLYMVGGTWRALAAMAMRETDSPVADAHGFPLATEVADRIAAKVTAMNPQELARTPGVSSSRAAALPDAAAMLRVMLDELKPDGIVFSAWGLREGLLFQRLNPAARAEDPLLAGVALFTAARGGSATVAAEIADWSASVLESADDESVRLRLAAAMLALALDYVEPALRARCAMQWALDKRWLNLSADGRARIATVLLASCGKVAPRRRIDRLSPPGPLREAVAWGLAMRLARRIGAGSSASLKATQMYRGNDKLVLSFDPAHAQLASDIVYNDLRSLAECLSLEAVVDTSGK